MEKILCYVDRDGVCQALIDFYNIENKHGVDIVKEVCGFIFQYKYAQLLFSVEIDGGEINFANVKNRYIDEFKALCTVLEPGRASKIDEVHSVLRTIFGKLTSCDNKLLYSNQHSTTDDIVKTIDANKDSFDGLYIDVKNSNVLLNEIIGELFTDCNIINNMEHGDITITAVPEIYDIMVDEEKRIKMSNIFNGIIEKDTTSILQCRLTEYILSLSLSDLSLTKIAKSLGDMRYSYSVFSRYVFNGLPCDDIIDDNANEANKNKFKVTRDIILPNFNKILNDVLRHHYRLDLYKGGNSLRRMLECIDVYHAFNNKSINVADYIKIDEDNCKNINKLLKRYMSKDISILNSLVVQLKEKFGDTIQWQFMDNAIYERYFPFGVANEFSKYDSTPDNINLGVYWLAHEFMVRELNNTDGLYHTVRFLSSVDDSTYDNIKYWIAYTFERGYINSGWVRDSNICNFTYILGDSLLTSDVREKVNNRLKDLFKIIYAYSDISENKDRYYNFAKYVENTEIKYLTEDIEFSKVHKTWIMENRLSNK